MPFSRPTLSDLVAQVQQDFVSRLDLPGPLLRKAIEYVLSRVIAGASHMTYGFLQYISQQFFPQTADRSFLILLGTLRGVPPESATFAVGTVTVGGTNGTTIPAGTVFTRQDGVQYTSDADVTIASGMATPALTAALADENSNCDVGTVLTLSVTGADSTATVVTLSGGTDEETTDAYRIRVVAAWQNPPQGGNEDDYIAWAKEVPGVTRVWVTPNGLGLGTVVIRFVRDNDVDIIPDGGEVATVQAHITAPDKAPVLAAVTTVAPIADPTAFNIHLSPSSTAIQNEVAAELADFFRNTPEPGNAAGSIKVLISDLRTTIGQAVKLAGGTDYVMSSPSADIVPAEGHLPTLGTITWS